MPNKNQHYGKKDLGKDEITFSVGKIAESMWRAMVWACNDKENAVIDSLKNVYQWRSTRWW